jgi:hypothetical protein
MSPVMGTVYLPGTRVITLDPFKSDSSRSRARSSEPVVVSCDVQERSTTPASFSSVLSVAVPRVTLPAGFCGDRHRAER